MSFHFFNRATGIASFVLATVLVGCGGSNSASTNTVSLTGLAATGAGIANGAVTARCASGPDLIDKTDGNGVFTLDLGTGRTLPCMLKVSGGTPAVTLYSYAQAAGRVNITPATDLVVARALGADPDTQFSTFSVANGTTIETNLAAAKTYANAQLSAVAGAGFGKDILTGAFAIGDADDKVLDIFGAALVAANKTIADLRSEAKSGTTLSVSPFLPAPGSVTATANSASQITLAWGAVPGATSYKVFKSASAGAVNIGGTAVATPSTPTFMDTGLSAATAYYYKVVASNAVATSAATAEYTATTAAASGGGSGSGLTCDTTKFQSGAPVATPTAEQLTTFARTYTGSEGDFNDAFVFVASGSATLIFNANGTATYNNVAYAPSSYCLETLSGGGTQLVIHSGAMSHFDLKTNGAWSGYTPSGKVVKDAAYSGGSTPSTWTVHALPNNTGSFADVVWDGSKFVAIGTYVGTSTDGATWTFNALVEGKGIAKSGSTLLLAGISTATGSDTRKSVNGGTTWTKPTTANIFTVTGNSTMFVGIGGGAEAGNGQAMVLRTSTDGETWTTRYTEAVPNAQSKVTSLKPIWSGSKWLISAVKYDPTQADFYAKYEFFVLTSTDGMAWTKTVLTNVKGSYIWPWWPVWTGSEFVLIDRTKTLKSRDGVTWPATATTSNFTSFGENTYDYVSFTGKEFVAFSGGGSIVKVWTSADAVTWTSTTTTATQPIYGGVSNGSIYVAVGNQYVFTSP